MWKWSCPTKPDKVFEHHSSDQARVDIVSHAILDSCSHIHELMDDGIPCGNKDCDEIYIPAPYARKASSNVQKN